MGRELVTSNARTSREDALSEVWFGGLACAVRGSGVGGPMQYFSRGTSSSPDSSRSPPACRERLDPSDLPHPVSVSSSALCPGRRSSRICVNARGFPPGPVCLLPACTTASLSGAGLRWVGQVPSTDHSAPADWGATPPQQASSCAWAGPQGPAGLSSIPSVVGDMLSAAPDSSFIHSRNGATCLLCTSNCAVCV